MFRDIESAKIALSRLLDVMESNSPGSPQVSSYVQAILQSELGRRLNLANSFSSQDSNAQVNFLQSFMIIKGGTKLTIS